MYTFAFLPHPPEPLSLPQGIQGALTWVGDGELGAVVEPDFKLDSIQSDDQALVGAVVAHDRVIQDLFQLSVLLPLQFGTQFHSTEGLLNHLQQQRQTYGDRLQVLAGKVEYILRCSPKPLEPVLEPSPPPEQPLKGRDYFRAKKQQYQSLGDCQNQQQTQLQTLITTIQRIYPDMRQGEAQDGQERFYLLVGQRRSSHLQKQVNQWQGEATQWDLLLSEPLPPYHFVQ